MPHRDKSILAMNFRISSFQRLKISDHNFSIVKIMAFSLHKSKIVCGKLPKNIQYSRRQKQPLDFDHIAILKKNNKDTDSYQMDSNVQEKHDDMDLLDEEKDDSVWGPDEVEAISSLFQGRIPQKPGKLTKERPLPLPIPHTIRPLGLPTPKKYLRSSTPSLVSPRSSITRLIYKNPDFLIGLAREIQNLPKEKGVSEVLDKWNRFLRKGSLSLTIRELGHIGLPERALQTFCWAQKHPHLFPDDRILSSTVEILSRTHGLKTPFNLERLMNSANRTVIEAMARGLIKGGRLHLARKLILLAKDSNRTLDPSIYAKLILELGKNPDKYNLINALLDEVSQIDDLKLQQQDCTSIMKICVKLGKFEIVESLFSWFKNLGHDPSVVMYTTVIYSRFTQKKYREAFALVWEMEELNYLLDLPAFRVVIKLCVALNDLPRATKYFSRLKEYGFSPTYDIYRSMIQIYLVSGRLFKCNKICQEAEMAGFKLDKEIKSSLLHMEEMSSSP